MHSIPLNDDRVQYLARKRENQARYRANHPGREATNKKNNQEYQDREQRRNAKRHAAEWHLHPSMAELVIIDGEADDAGHYYLFQAWSPLLGLRTLRVEPTERLSLLQVVWFLRRLARTLKKEHGKRAIFLYFAMAYDISQQLYGSETRGEFTHDEAQAVWNMRSRHWGAVRGPDFRPELLFERHHIAVQNGRKQGYVKLFNDDLEIVGRVAWQDMFSLSGKSLVRTIEDWSKFWTDAEKQEYGFALESVRLGKEARGRWQAAGMSLSQIETEYQLPELRLMHWYASKIVDLCASLELAPRSLAGPAPMARALLTQYGVTAHIKPAHYDTVEYQDGPLMREWIRPAMFGGNVQLCQTGVIPGYIKYDINSAYPHWIRQLPCMAHGNWRLLTPAEILYANQHGRVMDHAIYDVAWRCPPGTRWPPFPVRNGHGGIVYPLSGIGRYCSPEVQAFLRYHPHADYDIRGGWTWEPTCQEYRPFAEMIERTFDVRAGFKALGMPEAFILKLALNSVYGVLAQTSGSYRLVDEYGVTTGYHTPEHGNLFAAAYVTSGCRADLMRMIAACPGLVIATATDAVIAVGSLLLECGDGLGEISMERCSCETACIAPGVLAHADGHNKYRGVPSQSVWYVDDTPCPSMWDAYQLARAQGRPMIQAAYDAYQNPYAAGSDPMQYGQFVPSRRVLDITSYVLASKRNIARQEPSGYCPPYEQPPVRESQAYVRPMDKGGETVPDRPEVVEP